MTDRTYLVAEVKADLIAKGIIPAVQTSNCHAFAITARVAWRLRGDGAKLLLKSAAQTFCLHDGTRYGIDAIAFPDGWVDCLVHAGPTLNENRPAWQTHPGAIDLSDPDLYAAPVNLDAGLVAPEPEPEPDPATPDLARADLVDLALQVANLAQYLHTLAIAAAEERAAARALATEVTFLRGELRTALKQIAAPPTFPNYRGESAKLPFLGVVSITLTPVPK